MRLENLDQFGDVRRGMRRDGWGISRKSQLPRRLMQKKQLRGCLHTVIDDLMLSPLPRLRLIGFLVGLRSIEYEYLTCG